MLRIDLLPILYNLSDLQMEGFLHENVMARKFVGLEMADRTSDESIPLLFRYLLERHSLGVNFQDDQRKHQCCWPEALQGTDG